VQWLDALPLWVVYLLVVAFGMATIELGDILGRYWARHSRAVKGGNVDSLVAATLALLAFLLVFMTGLANNRFETRRQLVIAEANAVGTTYLRAGFLDEPQRSEVRALLREYVEMRLEVVTRPELFQQARARSEAIQAELWQYAENLSRSTPTPVAALFVSSVNNVIDLHTERMAAINNRFPVSNWLAIFTVAVLVLLVVGYNDGLSIGRSDGRGQVAELVLLLVFASVLLLIIDLDRAGEGLLKVSQQAMIDLQQQIRAGGS